MPPRQPPDLAATIARMEGRLAELERTVRRGKAAPKIRDLGDADMAKATDGQVPTYNEATGRYKPSSVGAPATAWFGTGGMNVPALPSSAYLTMYEEYNYSSGLFTLTSATTLRISRSCIVRVEAWVFFASQPADYSWMIVYGLDGPVRRDVCYQPNGEEANLSVATTDRWDPGIDLRVNLQHNDTGSNANVSSAAVALTHVRDI